MTTTTSPRDTQAQIQYPSRDTIRLALIALSAEEFLEWLSIQLRSTRP